MSPAAKGKVVLYVYIPKGLMERLDRYIDEFKYEPSRSSIVDLALDEFLNNNA